MTEFKDYNHLLIQFFASVAFALLFACTPENNHGGNDDNGCDKEVAATAIKLNKNELTLEKSSNETLTVTFTPSNVTNKTLTWVSSNESVVKVTDGIVVAVDAGGTEIIVKQGDLTDKCTVTVVVSATSITLEPAEVELAPGETVSLTATVLPGDSTDEVEWSSSGESVATVKDGVVTAVAEGSTTITAKAGAQEASCNITVKSKMKAIDLGLTVKWAECNLGASTPEKYGDYFAWGEVEPYYSSQDPLTWKDGKSGYNWASYKWANGDYNKLTKYCQADNTYYWDGEGEPDGKTVLDYEDDAAHVILGGKWRMPTRAEQDDLRTKCTWTWDNTKNGYTITGTNGNSIFLPAAGLRGYADLVDAGSWGYYWSSSLGESSDGAYGLLFYSSRMGWRLGYRYDGFTVRPVTE